MLKVIGPIKQTAKQKEYCKRLGIKDINKVKTTWFSVCPHCGEVDAGETDWDY